VPRRVLSPELVEGGEGWCKDGSGRVASWGGAGDPGGGQLSSVPAVGNNKGEACFAGQDGRRGGEKVVRCPSLHPRPKAVHSPEWRGVRGEQVDPLGKYWKEEAISDVVAEVGPDARPRGGQAFDKGEDGLG